MQFEDPQDQSTAYLILRHIYDGDVIEWPIGDDHPLRHIFVALEQQGFVARWDRVWPLHDRYRLTDKGIAAIEAVYKPAGAEQVYRDVRGQNLSAPQRRQYLTRHGYDPTLWPLLHDPSTHWDLYRTDRGRYYDWFWEDQYGYRSRRQGVYGGDDDGPDLDVPDVEVADDDPGAQRAMPYVVDLDREANASDPVGPASGDYDVS